MIIEQKLPNIDFKLFLSALSDLELVVLQHELRTYKEDKLFLELTLEEIKKRDKK